MPRPSIRYVFIAPHADDELLSMGAAIHEHILTHGPDRVAVVLAGTGEASGARHALRDAGYVPVGETAPQRRDLSRREFVASRDAEFYESCRALGVPHSGIYMPGFTLTESDGSVYRRGSYTTASIPRLARMREGWGLPDARHYFPPYRLDRLPRDAPPTYWHDARSAWLPALHEAGMAYGRWEPERGRYSIGWFSVGAFFGGPAGDVLRCPSRVPPATRAAECGRVGSVSAPNVPFFEHARTVMHL